MPIGRGMDKEDVVRTHDGILCSHEKWFNNAVRSNTDGSGDEHTRWSHIEKDTYHMTSWICGISKKNATGLPWWLRRKRPMHEDTGPGRSHMPRKNGMCLHSALCTAWNLCALREKPLRREADSPHLEGSPRWQQPEKALAARKTSYNRHHLFKKV